MKHILYLTLEEVLAIHDSMIDNYGGSYGLRDLGLLHAALARPASSFDSEDLYPTIYDKAAALFHSLLFNHVFVDGNKRTSLTSTARFLDKNGLMLTATEKDLVSFPLHVENTHEDIERIAIWLREHTRMK